MGENKKSFTSGQLESSILEWGKFIPQISLLEYILDIQKEGKSIGLKLESTKGAEPSSHPHYL